jgi:intracellular sulfur oxidation DsrE/DsrF family protein
LRRRYWRAQCEDIEVKCVRKLAVFLLLGLAFMATPGGRSHAKSLPSAKTHAVRVVYHLDFDSKRTMTALHQVKNQLTDDPTARVVVVAIGESVPFMTRGSKTAGGYPFELMVEDLQEMGVRFEACGNTMTTLKIKSSQLDDGIVVVASGMAELARRQSRDGYAYIKP